MFDLPQKCENSEVATTPVSHVHSLSSKEPAPFLRGTHFVLVGFTTTSSETWAIKTLEALQAHRHPGQGERAYDETMGTCTHVLAASQKMDEGGFMSRVVSEGRAVVNLEWLQDAFDQACLVPLDRIPGAETMVCWARCDTCFECV